MAKCAGIGETIPDRLSCMDGASQTPIGTKLATIGETIPDSLASMG